AKQRHEKTENIEYLGGCQRDCGSMGTNILPVMPSEFEPVSWGGWEGRWRVYCEGLRAITAIFFKGFSTLMFIVTTVTAVWVFAWYQGWASSSHPAFLSSIGVALISFAIYLRGSSIAAWLKVDRLQ